MLPTCFESNGLSVLEKKQKIDFQDGCHDGHLGFLIGMILAIFDLQVTLMLSTYCAFDIFQKAVFCLTLYTEVNLNFCHD